MLTLALGYPPCGFLLARVQRQLDRSAEEFRMRPLTKHYRYLFIDGLVVKIRDGKLAKECVVFVAVGIDDYRVKEIIGYLASVRVLLPGVGF